MHRAEEMKKYMTEATRIQFPNNHLYSILNYGAPLMYYTSKKHSSAHAQITYVMQQIRMRQLRLQGKLPQNLQRHWKENFARRVLRRMR